MMGIGARNKYDESYYNKTGNNDDNGDTTVVVHDVIARVLPNRA